MRLTALTVRQLLSFSRMTRLGHVSSVDTGSKTQGLIWAAPYTVLMPRNVLEACLKMRGKKLNS